MEILVVDIETTGFQVDVDIIVEIGIVLVDTVTKKTELVFNEIIKDEKFNLFEHENSWIFQNTTLKPSDVMKAKPISYHFEAIQGLFDKYKMTAYNKGFDIKFLTAKGFVMKDVKCLLESVKPYSNYRFPNGKKKIPSVEEIYAQFFMGEDETYVEEHRAGQDALDEAKILLRLVDIKNGTATKGSDKIIIYKNTEKSKEKGLDVDDIFKFGKYKGRKFSEIVKKDSQYIKWLVGNLPTFQLTDEAKKLLT